MSKKDKGFDFFDHLRGVKSKVTSMTGGDFHKLDLGQNVFYLVRKDEQTPIVLERSRHGIHICPEATDGASCKGCAKIITEAAAGNKEFEKEWKLKPAGYFWAFAKARLKTLRIEDIKILQVPGGVLNDILTDMLNGRFDPSAPDEARPLIITKRNTNDRYKVKYSIAFGEERDISAYLTEEILAQLKDLEEHEYTQSATNKDILDAMAGGGKKKSSASKDSRDDYTPDEVEDDDFSEDEPPEPAPAPAPKAKPKATTKPKPKAKPAPPPDDEFDDDTSVPEDGGEEDYGEDGEGDLTPEEEDELLGGSEDQDPEPEPPKPVRKPQRRKSK